MQVKIVFDDEDYEFIAKFVDRIDGDFTDSRAMNEIFEAYVDAKLCLNAMSGDHKPYIFINKKDK